MPAFLLMAAIAATDPSVPSNASEDVALNLIAITLIVLPLWDWRVAWRLYRAARKPPRIDALWASTYSSIGIAVGATLAALLGFNRLEAVTTGTSGILPAPFALGVLAVALIVVSLPNIPKERFLSGLVSRPTTYHKRDGEDPHPHRRWDDPPEERTPPL